MCIIGAISFSDQQDDDKKVFTNYVIENESKWFLSSQLYSTQLLGRMNLVNEEARDFYKHGPALTLESEENVSLDIISDPREAKTIKVLSMTGFDVVPAVEVEQWPEISADWVSRERHWPKQEVVTEVVKHKCHLVPVPHHNSTCPEIEWRLSFSVAEKELARGLTKLQRQIYIFVKYILWRDFINKHRTLSSYHLKTAFFWLMEELPLSLWKEENFSQIVRLLAGKLVQFLLENNWPNYFIPSNNMVGHLKKEDLEEVTAKVQAVKEDILSCVLSCSSGTHPAVLEEHVFKAVFSPIFNFMHMDKGLFKDQGDTLANALGGEWLEDELMDDEILDDELLDDGWSSDEIEKKINCAAAVEELGTEEEDRRKSKQNEGESSGIYEREEEVKCDKTEKETGSDGEGEIGRCEHEEMDEIGIEENSETSDDTVGNARVDRINDACKRDGTTVAKNDKNIERSPSENSGKNQQIDADLLSRFNIAKGTSLLNLAKIYQVFHSYDFSVQILEDL